MTSEPSRQVEVEDGQLKAWAIAEPYEAIEYNMLNLAKFMPAAALSTAVVRSTLYPFGLIRTRIQLQRHKSVYKGTFDAFIKIKGTEGVRGLYRGFMFNNLMIFPSLVYVSVYEKVRHDLSSVVSQSSARALIGGLSASICSQSLVVPIDVINQHQMILGLAAAQGRLDSTLLNPLRLSPTTVEKGSYQSLRAIIHHLYHTHGFSGFYKGYFASLSTYAPASGLWWLFYDVYGKAVTSVLPTFVPQIFQLAVSGSLTGISVSILTNPLDATRARVQLERKKYFHVMGNLWREERMRIFTKGLSARILQSTLFSFTISVCYESVKRYSISDEYKHLVRW